MQLCEKYRPQSWADVIGQGKAIAKIRRYGAGGYGGQAFWISGQTGTGKTTLARLIAGEVAGRICIEEVAGRSLTVGLLADWRRKRHLYGLGKGGWAFIVNEVHGLRKDVLEELLVFLEPIPEHCVVIFTTTCDGQEHLFENQADAGPLLGRCVRVELARRDLTRLFAARCQAIARAEGLDGQPMARYVRLLQTHRNSLRAALQAVQAGEMAKCARG